MNYPCAHAVPPTAVKPSPPLYCLKVLIPRLTSDLSEAGAP